VNWSAELVVELWPPTVTFTSTVPDPCGLFTVHDVAEVQFTPVPNVVPKAIVVPPVVENPVPLTVTVVPPAAGPEVGLTDVTVGAEEADA
jgi:hypothetical protein